MTALQVSDRPFPEKSEVEGGSALHPSSPPRPPAMSPRGPPETTVATPEGSKGVLGTREARDPEGTGAWEGLLGKLGLDGSWRIFTDGKREWEGKGDPGVRNSGSGRS